MLGAIYLRQLSVFGLSSLLALGTFRATVAPFAASVAARTTVLLLLRLSVN